MSKLRCGFVERSQVGGAEGLTLLNLKADNATGYFGVHLAKPYQAQVRRGG